MHPIQVAVAGGTVAVPVPLTRQQARESCMPPIPPPLGPIGGPIRVRLRHVVRAVLRPKARRAESQSSGSPEGRKLRLRLKAQEQCRATAHAHAHAATAATKIPKRCRLVKNLTTPSRHRPRHRQLDFCSQILTSVPGSQSLLSLLEKLSRVQPITPVPEDTWTHGRSLSFTSLLL